MTNFLQWKTVFHRKSKFDWNLIFDDEKEVALISVDGNSTITICEDLQFKDIFTYFGCDEHLMAVFHAKEMKKFITREILKLNKY